MKRFSLRTAGIALALTALSFGQVKAETYYIDVVHSSIDFSIRHLVSRSKGKFNEYEGSVTYDKANPAATKIEATIKVESIDTGNERRDGHLKDADFFDAAKYPTITFKSKKAVEKDGKLHVTGDFTMHGVTKEITLPVEVLGVGMHPMAKAPVAGYSSDITLKRSDFGVDSWTDAAGVLGDEVHVNILIEAVAKK